jgi:transcription elongation factor Elf1
MKILKKGNKTLNMRITCAGCGSLLEASPEDFQVSLDKIYYVTCPNCKLTMRLSETELSEPMKWAINIPNSLKLNIDMDELDKNLSFLKGC